MAQFDADVIVIGGGPGGYPAAITAARLGGKTICIDFDSAGGTCLNWGCIPTKTLIASVAALEQAKHFNDFGLTITGVIGYNFPNMMARKDKVVNQLVKGVEFLLGKNKVQFIKGKGRLLDKNTVEVVTRDGSTQKLTAASIILATGSVPKKLPVPGLDGGGTDSDVFIDNREAGRRLAAGKLGSTALWTSNEAVSATEVPKKLVIMGGGVVGIEFAYVYRGLGSDVTVVEMLPNILSTFDEEITGELSKLLVKSGIKILTNTKVAAVNVPERKLKYVQESGRDGELEFDKLLVSVGRAPYTAGLGLEDVGVTTDRGKVPVNEFLRTNIPNIYAIGDVNGGGLAHVATREGEVAASNAMGHSEKMDYKAIPSCVYTEPELASTGLTEKEARALGHDVKVGKFTFKSLGKAMAINENVGLVKIVSESKYGEILGAHIVGPHATDLIHEICVSMKLESTVDELMHTIHAHPSLSEAVMEAAQDVKGESVHK